MRRSGPAPDERGVAAIEFAVLAPVLLLLVWFVVQAALYFYGRSVALQTTRDAVSQYRLAQTPAAFQAMQSAVAGHSADFAGEVGSGALDGVVVTPTYTADEVSVRVTGTTISLVPGLTLHVSQTAHGTIEKFEDLTP